MPWGSGTEWIVPFVRSTLHVPGVRGNSWRTYPAPPVNNDFPGTFEPYAAGVVEHWQKENNHNTRGLNLDLGHLGLAKKVLAQRLSDAEIDLRVSPPGKTSELVSVADVGSGVPQIIPALVALRVPARGQLVYLEEPEMRLHPRAQIKLADILADAAKRGVRVVAETHSSLLLRAVQTLVAKQKLSPDLVRLHWFSLDKHGVTRVSSATPDQRGAFGKWPQDFGDVALDSEQDYLDAVESQLAR
jgi:AAA domain, putative AbiEii toxin, Type IV TA system